MPSNGNSKNSKPRAGRKKYPARRVLPSAKKRPVTKKIVGVHARKLHKSAAARSAKQIKATVRHARRHQRRQVARDIVLALILALGLSTVFLSPLKQTNGADGASQGQVLGQAIVAPLTIPVSVTNQGVTNKIITNPTYGTLPEALGQAAANQGTNFYYTSRGASAYLWRFFDQVNGATGGWAIKVNGLPVADLLSIDLLQGDQVTAERETI